MRTDSIAPVPVVFDGKEEVELRISPVGQNAVRVAPYCFDIAPLIVTVRARILPPGRFSSAIDGLEAYHKALRQQLTFAVVS